MTTKTFIKITNRDIYEKICSLEEHVKITNGKVKLNRWMASTALMLVIGTMLSIPFVRAC